MVAFLIIIPCIVVGGIATSMLIKHMIEKRNNRINNSRRNNIRQSQNNQSIELINSIRNENGNCRRRDTSRNTSRNTIQSTNQSTISSLSMDSIQLPETPTPSIMNSIQIPTTPITSPSSDNNSAFTLTLDQINSNQTDSNETTRLLSNSPNPSDLSYEVISLDNESYENFQNR